MTRRERVLGLVLLGALGAGSCLLGARLYGERLRAMDADIAAAEARVARLEPAPRRKARTAAASSPELFLAGFDRLIRSAGWTTESTTFTGRKDGRASFSISVAGPGSGWERLLAALEAWDERVFIASIEATAMGKGRMRSILEAGYAAE